MGETTKAGTSEFECITECRDKLTKQFQRDVPEATGDHPKDLEGMLNPENRFYFGLDNFLTRGDDRGAERSTKPRLVASSGSNEIAKTEFGSAAKRRSSSNEISKFWTTKFFPSGSRTRDENRDQADIAGMFGSLEICRRGWL